MAKITLISANNSLIEEIKTIISSTNFDVEVLTVEEEIENQIVSDATDIVLFDSEMPDVISILRKLKLQMQTKDVRSILLFPEENLNYDFLKYTNSYIYE